LIHFLLCYVPAQIMIIVSLLLSFTNHNMSNHILSLAYKLAFFYGWPMYIILMFLDVLCHKIYLFIKKTRNKQKTGVVKMKKELSFIINEKKHIIKFVNGKLFKGEKLYVDGNEIEIENKLLKFFGIYDQEFTIDGKKCRAIFIGKDIDVVVNNKYVYSQKPYIPVNGISWWVWIYVVLSILIPIVAIGGALPTIIGILSLFWCVRTSVTPSISTLKKHLFCITIVMIAWLLFVSLVLG
ncbi:MAG: hypothetical protein IJN56_04945, partial [Clostridia bacterium]|nr:hypothetical protein [Clostridia bacterium]